MLNEDRTSNKEEDLEYNEDFDLNYERVDRIKSPEDDWVSHILGNEIDVIDTLIDN
jgi:hypothetical protein